MVTMSHCAPAQTLPASITAGLSFQALLSASDFPPGTWTAHAYLRGPGQIDLVGEPFGTAHMFSANAATTKDYLAGQYWYVIRMANGADEAQVESGIVNVLPDLAAQTTPYDGRSQAQVALEAIDAVLARRATIDQERYRINNRELYRTSISDLLKLRGYYAAQVKRELGCGRGRWGRQVPVRFTQ